MSQFTQEVLDELSNLKARIAELEQAAKPPEPFVPEPLAYVNPIDRAQAPVNHQAVRLGNAVLGGIVSDSRARTNSASMIAPSPTSAPQPSRGKNGWIDAKPLAQPSVGLIDNMVEADSTRQRNELAAQLGRSAASPELENAIRRARLSKPLPKAKPAARDAADIIDVDEIIAAGSKSK